jgi:hypothetical protein
MMTSPQHAAASTPLVDRFLSAVRRRQPKHVTENFSFVAMLWRQLRALEFRAIDDPELLPQLVAMGQRLDEMVDVVIASNALRYDTNPSLGASAAECGRILGHKSKQTTSYHTIKGRAIIARREQLAGAVPINDKGNPEYSSEARRERAAIELAAEHAVTTLADWRARKAS